MEKTDQLSLHPFPCFTRLHLSKALGHEAQPTETGRHHLFASHGYGTDNRTARSLNGDVDSTQPLAMAGAYTYPNVDKADMESSWVSEDVSVSCCELTIRNRSQMSLLWVIFMIFMALSLDGFSRKGFFTVSESE